MADPEETRRSEALIQAGLVLASELSLPSVLQKIVDVATEVADARYGALGVLAPDGTHIQEFITYGVTEDERRAIGHIPHGLGLLGALIHDAKPLRLERIQGDYRSVGFPENHPPMRSFLGVPLKIRGRVFGNLYLTEKRGAAEFTDDDERAVITLASQAAVAIENARLYKDASLQQQRLAAVNDVTRSILEGQESEPVLRKIAAYAKELVEAAVATIAVPHDDERLKIDVAVGEGADVLLGAIFEADRSVSGEVMRTGQAITVQDAANDPRMNQPIVQLGNLGPAMFVPLAAGGRSFGTLSAANHEGGRAFTREDLTLLQVFAAQAGVALEYARVRSELNRYAVLEDRERIAKDLHDGVVQSLFAVGMSLQALEVVAEGPNVKERLAGAVDDIDHAIRDIRNYIFALRPGHMADWQLQRALTEIAADFSKGTDTSITVDIDATAAARLSSKAADVVQLAREALSNAVRHAQASRIELTLHQEGSTAVLCVSDDGAGFDPDAARGTGHGLLNLGERARALGGLLELTSIRGNGTKVTVEIPL